MPVLAGEQHSFVFARLENLSPAGRNGTTLHLRLFEGEGSCAFLLQLSNERVRVGGSLVGAMLRVDGQVTQDEHAVRFMPQSAQYMGVPALGQHHEAIVRFTGSVANDGRHYMLFTDLYSGQAVPVVYVVEQNTAVTASAQCYLVAGTVCRDLPRGPLIAPLRGQGIAFQFEPGATIQPVPNITAMPAPSVWRYALRPKKLSSKEADEVILLEDLLEDLSDVHRKMLARQAQPQDVRCLIDRVTSALHERTFTDANATTSASDQRAIA